MNIVSRSTSKPPLLDKVVECHLYHLNIKHLIFPVIESFQNSGVQNLDRDCISKKYDQKFTSWDWKNVFISFLKFSFFKENKKSFHHIANSFQSHDLVQSNLSTFNFNWSKKMWENNLFVFEAKYVRLQSNNGMLHHSLATLEQEQDFIFFTEPSYPKNLPSLFICKDFFSFCLFNHGRACLQAWGLARGTAISVSSLFWST